MKIVPQEIQLLRKQFDQQKYDEVITVCSSKLESEHQTMYAKLQCACYIKKQDLSGLKDFLLKLKEQDKQLYYSLSFERAYIDFKTNQNANWFLKVKSSNPMSTLLKAQIAAQQRFNYQHSYIYKKSFNSNEGQTFQLAMMSMNPNNLIPNEMLKNYQQTNNINILYNLLIYYISRNQYQQAQEVLNKLKTKQNEITQKSMLRFIELLISSYISGEADFNAFDESEDIIYPLCIISQLLKIKFVDQQTTYSEALYQQINACIDSMTKLSNKISQEYLKNQSVQIITALKCLIGKQTTQKLSYKNQHQSLAHFILQCLYSKGLLQQQDQQTASNQYQKFILQQQYSNLICYPAKVSDEVKNNSIKILCVLKNYGQLKAYDFCNQQLPVCTIVQYIKALYSQYEQQISFIPIIFSKKFKIQKEKKPMPTKWLKKQKSKQQKQQHHQGAIADKAEVSKVQTASYNRGSRHGNYKKGGKGGKGRR